MNFPATKRFSQHALFTLNPSHAGGRKARTGFEMQDHYTASVLAGLLVGNTGFLIARIEAVEDLEIMLRTERGWLERYYQIKSKQEGTNRWTISALNKEQVWTRFFSLYRNFLLQRTEQSTEVEFVVALEGDLDPDLIALRDNRPPKGPSRAKLLDLLSNEAQTQNPTMSARDAKASVEQLIDNFLLTLRIESRVGHLRDVAINCLTESGDASPEEVRKALDRLLHAIREESARSEPTLITTTVLKEWLGLPERAILQRRPVPNPEEVPRNKLTTNLARTLDEAKVVLLYGTPKIGKSHLVSAVIDRSGHGEDYFWFTFSGSNQDKEALAFQLALWVGQRTSVWQPRDDIQNRRLPATDVISRLRCVPMANVYLVFDDCHNASDRALLKQLASLANTWKDARIVFISEGKIPELASDVRTERINGLEPAEGLRFLSNLGINVMPAVTELALLCVQADGHPALLKAIAAELPERPSATEITRLSGSLTTAKAVQPFLEILSEQLFRSLKMETHRRWLARLAVLFSFRRELALEMARFKPEIEVSDADWHFLTSQIFDQTGAEQYVVPPLLRPLLKAKHAQPDDKTIYASSARHILKTARVSSRIDFWDFHAAIINLVLAEQYEEAANHFIVSIGPSIQVIPLDLLEILFMTLNADAIQRSLHSLTRFTLLSIEANTRLLDDSTPDYSKILALMRRMRAALKSRSFPAPAYAKTMMHMIAALARMRRIKDQNILESKARQRAFAAIEAALRRSLRHSDPGLTVQVLEIYNDLCFMGLKADLELLKQAILTTAPDSSALSCNSLIYAYTQTALNEGASVEALGRYERHSDDYRLAGNGNAFFAAEHALATIQIEKLSMHDAGRKRIEQAALQATTMGASPQVTARAQLVIADSYWIQKNYEATATNYREAAAHELCDDVLAEYARDRATDSEIFLQRFDRAVAYVIQNLRRKHSQLSPIHKGRLYARLAYAYAECGLLKKAAIACMGGRRIAQKSGLTELDFLSVTIAGWVLQHLKDPDVDNRPNAVQIRDSAALSERPSAEQLKQWRNSDPPFARGLMLVGRAFELTGDLRRSEALYRRAAETAARRQQKDRFQEFEYVYEVRIAQVLIRQLKFTAAAETFKGAAEGLAKLRGSEGKMRAAAAYALLSSIEPYLGRCSDSEVTAFFGGLDKQFSSDQAVRAWLLFRESELMFARLLVQAAKRKLLEAESLAKRADQHELLWVIVQSKLFTHVEQMYPNQVSWFCDSLEAGLLLATDNRLSERQGDFSGAVVRLTARYRPPVGEVSRVIAEIRSRTTIGEFWACLFALWKVAKQHRFNVESLLPVQTTLLASGMFTAADLT